MTLVCVLAVGGSTLTSLFYFLGARGSGSTDAVMRWSLTLVHELACLALLGYVLARRSKSFADLGLTWQAKDVLWSIVLYVAGDIGFRVIYLMLKSAGLTSLGVGEHLFAAGISLPTILVQFINPIFEETIVRGYVMTEIRELTGSASKAVLASTLLQGSYHLYQGGMRALSDCGIFIVFSIYYAKTNRLAPVVLAHLYMDLWALLAYAFVWKA